MARDLTETPDEELLPEGASIGDFDTEEEFDINNLRVDFTDKESSSEARDFDPLPAGKYHVAITEVEIKKSSSAKNPGKPFYALTLTVQSGPYENRKLWANVMLFNGALYSLVQINKALGLPYLGDGMKVPTPAQLEGQEFTVSVAKLVDKYKIEKQKEDGTFDPNAPKPLKNEVKSFSAYTEGTGTAQPGVKPGQNSMLP
jgi:Protein of unknown function (DUF669)